MRIDEREPPPASTRRRADAMIRAEATTVGTCGDDLRLGPPASTSRPVSGFYDALDNHRAPG
jgi:hypothetical protein